MNYGQPECCDDLTQSELWAMHQFLFIALNRVLRVKRRPEELRFPEPDPVYSRVKRAYDVLWELQRHLHYEVTRIGRRPPVDAAKE